MKINIKGKEKVNNTINFGDLLVRNMDTKCDETVYIAIPHHESTLANPLYDVIVFEKDIFSTNTIYTNHHKGISYEELNEEYTLLAKEKNITIDISYE